MADWQMIATLGCILLAGHLLTRRVLRARGDHQCGGCGPCQSSSSADQSAAAKQPTANESSPSGNPQTFVALDVPPVDRPPQRR